MVRKSYVYLTLRHDGVKPTQPPVYIDECHFNTTICWMREGTFLSTSSKYHQTIITSVKSIM